MYFILRAPLRWAVFRAPFLTMLLRHKVARKKILGVDILHQTFLTIFIYNYDSYLLFFFAVLVVSRSPSLTRLPTLQRIFQVLRNITSLLQLVSQWNFPLSCDCRRQVAKTLPSVHTSSNLFRYRIVRQVWARNYLVKQHLTSYFWST